MTNGDKYLKDGVDVEEFIRDITDNIGIVVTTSDITKPVGISIYADDFKKFLNTPLKPTLTEDEKVILRNIKENYTTIGRDDCGDIFIADIEDSNHIRDCVELIEFKENVFQFIKERRRI